MNSVYSAFASHPIVVHHRPTRLFRTRAFRSFGRVARRSRQITTVMKTTNPRVSYTRIELAEKLNGRMAMVGYLAGSGCELVTGNNYVDQTLTTWPFVFVLAAVLGFATFKTRGIDMEEKKPFTSDLELLNGRLAMMGMLAKFSYDLF